LPGLELPSDLELAKTLAEKVPGLELDAETHRREHAVEVQLPFLARLAPTMKIVGVAIHGGDLNRVSEAAEKLANVLRAMEERPLLIASGDMHHDRNGDDDRTRRLDRMVLDALQALDAERLYNAVVQNHIQTCALLPALLVMETLRHLGSLNRCETVGYATSADADPSSRGRYVVGYAAALFA
jgi:AmmeMemoRadiSam system protein B